MQSSKLAAFAFAASLAAMPMLTPASAATNYTGTDVTHPAGATAPSQTNPLLTDDGSVRIGKLIGTDVYNSQDQKLGSVDGVVIDKSGQPQVIISHNNKLVKVPWSDLQFGNAKANSDNKVLMTGMTKDQLQSMQEYHYRARS
ncbi:MAG: PRC-barrel domain-containing protein [Acetobacteraceae bacterium]|nr:PRC-barrel domain-containing protein [Acetobacteraceae bacterium]